ncbi:hypothetical protein CP98_03921 [Sphingobium yanoikuyae]|uniref:Uncharacterized protein n=1 Tax=Sphingobium yanoikuyae TaxID=13690 RepID=A0A084EFF4_SPHYA|nr:hypothetical protein [Sphingobium yanoikuyae]KEZ16696.1 hypothetical protein CP98_03921 [Sphingobium yanoikuyae]
MQNHIATMDGLLADAEKQGRVPIRWQMPEDLWVKIYAELAVNNLVDLAEVMPKIYKGVPVEYGNNLGNGGISLTTDPKPAD